jgi:predicted amidophosphoribosyltransferase
MSERRILVCDRCQRAALRVVEIGEDALCPRCALAVVDDAIRVGDVVAIEMRRLQDVTPVLMRVRR